MSVDFQSMFDRDIAKAVADLPTSAEWNGDDYEGAFSELRETAELEIAGIDIEYDATFSVRLALFDDETPQRGQTILIGEITYRIEGTVRTPDGVEVRLLLKNVTQ